MRNKGLEVRVARYHNIFGPCGTWTGGREKAPAAFCRKVAVAPEGGSVEIWGPGTQTRSFLYVDECVEATYRLMQSDFCGPVKYGHPCPIGVNGRNSDNTLYHEKLGWSVSEPLRDGMEVTYQWVLRQAQELGLFDV